MLYSLPRLIRQRINPNKLCCRFFSDSATNALPNDGPLSGIRILDFSRLIAGPFCTMLLGDLGAEIIKVEIPNVGDQTRKFGAPDIQDKENTYFMSLNRNKKGITLDLKLPKAREIARELAVKSDILIENFMPGTMARYGLDYEDFKSVAPRLIYCSITGFGPSGPYRDRPAIDIIASSLGGLVGFTKSENGDPVICSIPQTDISAGFYAHGAIMAALLERNKTGKGQRIDCDLLASQVSALIFFGTKYLNTNVEYGGIGGIGSGTIIPYNLYKTKDGFFSVTSLNDSTFRKICEITDLSYVTKDPKFIEISERRKNRKELNTLLKNAFAKNTTAYWLEAFEGTDVLHAPVNNIKQVFEDPQVVYKDMVKEANHSKVGKIKLIGPAVTFSDSVNKIRSPPPALGEHTDSVLSDVLSYSSEQIQQLREEKVFG